MKTHKRINIIFALIVMVYAIYAGIYIYQTSFVASGERYFVLFDDAMISMRYARNLAHGYGLVWNPGGARVEGYTNPLWVVFMAMFHLFPFPVTKLSLLIQISGAVFLIINLYFVKKIVESLTSNQIVPLLVVILTAFYNPLNNWGLQGMEVSVLTLLVSATLWVGLQNLRKRDFSLWLYLLLGISTLIRIDMAVPYLVILLFMALALPEHRRQNLLWGFGLFLVFILGQSLFRLWYYGDFLPNTYYLKMTGYPAILRIAHGFYVLGQFILQVNWLLFLFPFIALIFRRDRFVLLLLLVFLGQIAYSVYVGGDAWEERGGSNRYISIVMPLFFTLFVLVADRIRDAIANKLKDLTNRTALFTNLGLVLFVGTSMVNFNYLVNIRSLERWALLRQPLFIEGNKEYVQIALAVDKITTPQASLAVVTAGAIPYFSDRFAIDLLGKNDVKIAHEKVHTNLSLSGVTNFRPGHLKWDYDYSLGELKPDVVVQLWGNTSEAQPYIDQYYQVGGAPNDLAFSLRVGSENILWDQVQLAP
jgi:hypothetical protein